MKLTLAAQAWLQGPGMPTRFPHLPAILRTRRGVASQTQAGSQELQQLRCSRAALPRTFIVPRNVRTRCSEWGSSGGPAQTRSCHWGFRHPTGRRPRATAQRTSGRRGLMHPLRATRRRACASPPLPPHRAPQCCRDTWTPWPRTWLAEPRSAVTPESPEAADRHFLSGWTTHS